MEKKSKRKILEGAILELLSQDNTLVLPSERVLADRFGVNRLTVQRALLSLQDQGHVHKVPGRGYVRAGAVEDLWPILSTDERLVGFPIWYDSLADADWLRSPYALTLLRGIQEHLRLEGYELDIQAVGNADAPMKPQVARIVEHWKAIIRTSPPEGTHDVGVLAERLDHTVFINSGLNLPANRVSPDLVHAGELAMGAVLAGGSRKVLYLGRLDDHDPSNLDRIAGFKKAMHSFPETQLSASNGGPRMEDGYQTALHVLRSGEKFDAILGVSDYSALGALRACYECGFRVPDDIQIVGFGGYPLSSFSIPSLTTVDLHVKQTGGEAALLAIRLIRQQGKPQPIHDIQVSLIQGESTRMTSSPRVRARLAPGGGGSP